MDLETLINGILQAWNSKIQVFLVGHPVVIHLGSQNKHSDIANKYSSSLKMTHVSQNM